MPCSYKAESVGSIPTRPTVLISERSYMEILYAWMLLGFLFGVGVALEESPKNFYEFLTEVLFVTSAIFMWPAYLGWILNSIYKQL